MKQVLIIVAFVATQQVFADDIKQPCLQVKKACEAANFEKGKHKEGRGIAKDCMQKLANGESVPGVNISSDIVAACKDKREQHKPKKKN